MPTQSKEVARLQATLDVHGRVWSLTLSPDGKTIAASVDGAVQLWDATSGELMKTIDGLRNLLWSPDGARLLLTSESKQASVWERDQAASEPRPLDLKGKFRNVLWSPDGNKLLVAGEDNLITIWDAETLTPQLELSGFKKTVRDVKWSPNGRAILTVARDGSEKWTLHPKSIIQVWHPDTGKENFTITIASLVTKAEFIADGKYILTAADRGSIELWDAGTGNLYPKLKPPGCAKCGTYYAELSCDSTLVATINGSLQQETRDIACGPLLASIKTEWWDHLYIIGLSPDGRLLALYREHTKSWKSFKVDSSIQLHDTRTGELKATLTGTNMRWPAHQVVWSRDSKTLVTAGGSHFYQGKIWDVSTGKLRAELSLIAKENSGWWDNHFDDLDQLSFHPRLSVLIGQSQKLEKFWNPETGELLQEISCADVQLSQDGSLMATITPDNNSIQLWGFVKR